WATNAGGWVDTTKWAAGDFNGDGKSDIAASWNNGGSLSTAVYLSDGSRFPGWSQWSDRDGGWIDGTPWVAGDFNGDRKADLATVWNNGGSNTITVSLSTGSGFKRSHWATNAGGWVDTTKWAAGDFNGDGKSDIAASWANGDPNPPAPSEEQRFLDLINSERQKFGCVPLKADPKLTETARAHSKDLAGNPNLTAANTENRGHVGSDGSLPWDTNGGATTGRIHRDLGASAAQAQGENVHWGKGDTFDKAMDDWMNHDEASKWGHKYNIMGCDPDDPKNPYSNGDIARYNPPPTVNYKLVGVGIDQAADGTVYITQDFAG
ncbi:FG-GAP-like repeat-containing protein, partial [Streptomyces avidinii]|uniref:FG-GAP-like repeat-containing protein n=2 Tax=Streptomyces avidinii TaxID=1895 RepID=UPI001AE35600